MSQDAVLRQQMATMVERLPLAMRGGAMFPPAAVFGAAAITLSKAVAMLGVRAAAPYFSPYIGMLEGALAEVEFEPSRTVTITGAIWFVHLSRCVAQPLPAAAVEIASGWLSRLAAHLDWLEPHERRSLSYFAEPFGFPDMTSRFDAANPFLTASRSAAWPEFLRSFPALVAAEAVDWPCLFGAAALALPSEASGVGAEVHKQIMQEIAQGY